ncbi:hypothetical protein [Treponema sp.]|uniref:hypothetical protein n=1 Tax=Treponema sp. TaxID=166 RepID=UPI0038907EFD
MSHRKLIFEILLLSASFAFSETFCLSDIRFNSLGKTKPQYLLQTVPPLQRNHFFETKEELEEYLKQINQNLENTRLLENISYAYEITAMDDDIAFVEAEYTFEDSTSLLIFPKPSLDSNKGAELEIALKDTNFLGLASPLKAGLTFEFGDKDEPDRYSKFTPGFNIAYDYPFHAGKTKNHWDNLLDFRWCTEKSMPNFIYSTGITIGVPLGTDNQHELDFTARQSIVRNTDYSKYDDEFYFIEYGEVALPLTVGSIGLSTPITWKPLASIEKKWDKDGIADRNCDLHQSPLVKPGNEIFFGNVDWIGKNNFRNGYTVKSGAYMGFDLHEKSNDKRLVPSAEIYVKLHKAFDYAGINCNFTALLGKNTRYAAGTFIRGALDKAYFSKGIFVDDNNYAFTTNSAIILNLEAPIHVFTTDWVSFFGKHGEKHSRLLNAMNFELQVGPFIDMGLIDNWGTGNTFSIKEGIYTSGVEILVYPKKWKSYVLRGSLGFDLSKKLLDGHKGFDSSWRDGKEWECYIGLGLQF